MKGITCSEEAAKELIRICAPRRCKVNAIVLNDGDDPTLEAPSPEEIENLTEDLEGLFATDTIYRNFIL